MDSIYKYEKKDFKGNKPKKRVAGRGRMVCVVELILTKKNHREKKNHDLSLRIRQVNFDVYSIHDN